MSYHEFILVVNFSSIIILVLLAMLLLIATRFRGESGYAAAIIVLPNIPVYIYNMSRMLGWHDITLFFFPISFSVNTLLMPLLWLFTRRNFDLAPRFKPVQLLHFLPAIVCVVIVLSIPMRKRMESILHEVTGDDTWIGDFNAAVITSQMIGYFVAIFIYLYRKKQYIKDNWSDTEYMQKEWIPKLMILFAALFVTVMTCYAIWPRTDAWLIQILNVMAMSFLVYNFIAHPTVPYIQGTSRMLVKDETVGFQSIPDEEQMRDIWFPSERVSGDNKCFPAKGPFLIHIIERDRYLPKITFSVEQRILKTELLRAYQRDASGGSQAKVAPAGECWSYGR